MELDGGISAWFHICRGLGQCFVSFPLLFDTFGVGLVDVIIQRFTADPVIVSGFAFLDDTPEGDGVERLDKPPLVKVRRAV